MSCNPCGTYGSSTFRFFTSKLDQNFSSAGLGSSPFARHYLENNFCSLFLRLLRCFSSPGLPPQPNGRGYHVIYAVGFPIRTSAGQRLLATSPQLIAGCYVLHRFLMSRHPPYTLYEIFPHFCFQKWTRSFANAICFVTARKLQNKPTVTVRFFLKKATKIYLTIKVLYKYCFVSTSELIETIKYLTDKCVFGVQKTAVTAVQK